MTYDPLLEPEETSTGNFVLIPEGRHNGIIMAWEIDTEFESKGNKNKGWQFHLEIAFPQHGAQQQAWLDTSSNWGKQQVQSLLSAAEVPFTIPDRDDLSKTTGKPRKSYYKALVKEYNKIAGIYVFNTEALENKEVLWKIVHKIKCDGCRWLVAKTFTNCPNKNCLCDLTDCKTYATIDTTEILPPIKNSDLVEELKDSIKQETTGDKEVPGWVTKVRQL